MDRREREGQEVSENVLKETPKVVANFVENYRKEMEERLYSINSVEELEKSHAIVCEKVIEDMESRLPFKDLCFMTENIESFKSEKNKLFDDFKTQLLEKIESLHKKHLTALNVATDHYFEGMSDSLKAKDFLSTEELIRIHKQFRVSALKVYESHFEDNLSYDPLLKNYELALKESIDKEFEGFVEKNEQNLNSEEKKALIIEIYENKVIQSKESYKRKMNEIIGDDKYITDEELEEFNETIREEIISELNKQLKPSFGLEVNQFIEDIKQFISVEYQTYFIENQTNRHNICRHFESVSEVIQQKYSQTMNSVIDLVSNESDLNSKHNEVMEELLIEFSNGIQLMDTTLLESYQQNIQSFMKNELFVLQKKLNEKLEEIIKSNESISKLLITEYVQEMDNIIRNEKFFYDEDFEGLHSVYSNDIINKFKEHLKEISCFETQSYFVQLEQTIEEESIKLKERFQMRKDMKLEKLEMAVKKLEQMYVGEMKDNTKDITRIEDLNECHKQTVKRLLKFFKDSHRFRDESKVYPYIGSLVESFNQSLADFKDILEFKFQKIETLTKILRLDIRRYYKEEMQKYFQNKMFVQKFLLIKCHKLLLTNAIEKFRPEKGELTDKCLKELVEESTADLFAKIVDENHMKRPTESPAIGIDLGTTNSCVAIFNPDSRNPNNVVVIPNEFGNPTTPSVVSIRDNSIICVGDVAKDEIHSYPKNTISSLKRLIGRNFDDESVQNDMNLWPYNVIKDIETNNPKVNVKVDGQDQVLYPEQISAKVLKKMKEIAENHLGCEVTKAVITVPAYFNDGQKKATKGAGILAGLKVLRIINEPTAAAIAFKVDRNEETEIRKVLIFDFGGGTFDVSVLEINRGKIIVRAVGGDNHLGGDDFDTNIVKYCLEEFYKECNVRVEGEEGVMAMCRLRNKCEENKKKLTAVQSTVISIDNFYQRNDLRVVLTRDKFEELNHHLFVKSIVLVKETLQSKRIRPSEIDDVVLVGGSTRIPKIQEMLSKSFGGKPLNHWVNPDEAVAKGAAIHAAYLNGQRMDDPTKLEDVTPLSLGIEIMGKWMSVIIPRNSPVPIKITQTYITVDDYQTVVGIKIFEGEKQKINGNHLLGQFKLSGIPSALKGHQPIDVTFNINDEGILHVIAKIRSTGGEKDVKITEHTGRLTKEMIEQILLQDNPYGNLFK